MPAEVQLFDDLDAVAADAAGALDRRAQAVLFDRLDWFRLTLAHCPPPGRLLVAQARDGATAAWLFLMVDRGRAQALASWYTLRFDAVHHRPDRATRGCLEAIARALRRHGPNIHRLALAPVPDANGPALMSAFAVAGWLTARRETTLNWSITLATPDWDGYWAARPKRLRETVRRKSREAPLAIAIHDAFDDAAWAAYEQVYRASWKPAEGSWPFVRALAEQEGAAGTLRLGIARADGVPVAAQLWLVERGVATIHKLAHVERARGGSPGTLLSAAMFRHAIVADRVAKIDFGTGDDAYKADWTDTRVPLFALDAWNPAAIRGLAGAVRARARTLVRRVRKL